MKRNILSLAVGAALVAGVSSASSLETLQVKNPHANQQVAVDATFEKDRFRHAISLGEGKVRVIFQLEDAPAALFPAVNPSVNAQAKGNIVGDIDFSSQAAKEYKAFLNQKQNLVISSAKQIDSSLKADIRFDTLTNGFAAVVDKSKLQQLSKLPGVKAVYPDSLMHATMDRSLDVVNAPEVWEMLGGYPEAGKGVKVAIIDSGLRPENPLFSGEGFEAPDDVPTDDYCATVDESFCNGKVIAARAAEIPEGFSVVEEEFMSPMAFNGHGTHVAGTAAGNWGVEATRGDLTATISGVAPAAYLMIYKGLYATPANPASSSGSNSMLVSMLEASVADGADIVNNSWGGGSAVVSPLYEEIFVAAKAAGSTMVFAAGNDGPGSGTIGSPGTSGEVLTVGGSTTDRFTANFFSLAGSDVQNTLALTAGPVAVSEDITLPIVYAGSVDEANFEGCTAWENVEAFTGAMALISRGSCTFNDKIVFAQEAGASGVIIFNNQPDAGPIGMAVDDALLTVPAAMIGTNAGLATVEALGADAEAMATLTASVGVEDSMYNASSRGANADPEVFKPNLIAPGVQIFSGESPLAPGHEGENFSLKNGTSMASPHVAGAAALIKQMNPDWSAEQIMSAVTSTAVRDTLVSEDLESTPDAFDYGAGRLDIYRAANAQLTFSELGLATADCFGSCEWTVEVTNTSDADVTVSVNEMIMGEGYQLSVTPGNATLAAGSTTELTISVDATSASEFGEWVFGGVQWDDGNSETPEYFIPVAVNAVNTEDSSLLNTTSDASVVAGGEAVTLSASIDNLSITGEMTLTAEFATGFVVEESAISAMVDGEAQSVTLDADTNTATWTGSLNAANFAIAPNTKPADELAAFGISSYFSMATFGAAPLSCSSSCDDTFVTVNPGSPVTYLGNDYDTIHVSSNGFVVLGDDATGANFSLTQPLPSTDAPNNVVAPLWMDLDLDGGDGVGGGQLYATDLNLNSDFGCPFCGDYFVVEWLNAEIYQVEGESYTFQLWFEKGTNNAYFYYGAVGSFPAMLNQFGLGATVGAEDASGSVGITQARIASDNTVTGTLPTAGDVWGLSVSAGQSLAFSAQGALAERDALMPDTIEVAEDMSGSADVLANDGADPAVNTFTVSSGETSVRSFKALIYDFADFDKTSLAISTAPMNGTAEVIEGSVQYTPVADYNGADSFEYSVMDDGEMYTATVNVNVTAVNDAPVINAINVPSTTVEGGFVTVSVDASDVDGDDLTVTINGNEGASASLLAPQVSRDGGSLDITVTVSDGIETVTQTTAVTVNDAPKGSGSMAWYSLLLLPLTWLRRRKQA